MAFSSPAACHGPGARSAHRKPYAVGRWGVPVTSVGTLPTTLQEPFYQSVQGPEEEVDAYEALCSEVALSQCFDEHPWATVGIFSPFRYTRPVLVLTFASVYYLEKGIDCLLGHVVLFSSCQLSLLGEILGAKVLLDLNSLVPLSILQSAFLLLQDALLSGLWGV